jgi:hypothetical protein
MLFCISDKRFVLSAHDNEDKHKLLGGATGISFNYEYLPNTTDWYGRWRLASNRTNVTGSTARSSEPRALPE